MVNSCVVSFRQLNTISVPSILWTLDTRLSARKAQPDAALHLVALMQDGGGAIILD